MFHNLLSNNENISTVSVKLRRNSPKTRPAIKILQIQEKMHIVILLFLLYQFH